MKKLKYIYAFLVAVLLGFAVSSCEDDDVVAAEVTEETTEGSGETVKTTFTVGISAPDVSADIDPVTRASADNANIEYAKPENGGRFQNIVVVLVGSQINTGTARNPVYKHKIYGVHCHDWNDGVGVKEYNVIFSDINIDKDNDLGKEFKVYAFGNIPELVYTSINTDITANPIPKTYVEDWIPFYYSCVSSELSVSDPYNLSFKPGVLSYTLKYTYNGRANSQNYISTGMPVNNSATATVVKGNTQFNVAMKRVCARLQVTFRNFTGKTDYDDTYYGTGSKGNRVYVDNFVIKNVLATSTSYFYNGSAPSSTGSVNFDILQVLGGSNDHDRNKIENGEDLVVSMFVFENKAGKITEGRNQVQKYQYDLKVDRGKSLGQQVSELQDDNVYVMWSDNLDPGSYANSENRCLGANDNNILLVSMNDPAIIPYGTGDYGNRVFWHYNGGKFQSCRVNLKTDGCTLTSKYIPYSGGINSNYSTTLGNSYAFTPSPSEFEGFHRFALRTTLGIYMMISKNNLQSRSIVNFRNQKPYYPWVFFAKYIIKNGETFSTGTGSNKTTITQIDRNHSYELDFSVMPNYDTKQDILVNCVRKQNEINWSEVQK